MEMERIKLLVVGCLILYGGGVVYAAGVYPQAAIEVQAEPFDRDVNNNNGVLHDVVRGRNNPDDAQFGKWLNILLWNTGRTERVDRIEVIRGFVHAGLLGEDQATANARVSTVCIWGWRDVNGDGQATEQDSYPNAEGAATTKWVKLCCYDMFGCGDGNVVGWDVNVPVDTDDDAHTGYGDILQKDSCYIDVGVPSLLDETKGIKIEQGESWLLLIRAIGTANDFTNLMKPPATEELWDDGEFNDIGSNIPTGKYIDKDGKAAGFLPGGLGPDDDDDEVYFTPGTQMVQDNDVVWVYRAREK